MRVLILLSAFLLITSQAFAVAKSPHEVGRDSHDVSKNVEDATVKKEDSRTFGGQYKPESVHDRKRSASTDVDNSTKTRYSASSADGAENASQGEVKKGEDVGRNSTEAVDRDSRRRENWREVDEQRREQAEKLEAEK